jgi:hypothetical protein
VFHVWQMLDGLVPEAGEALARASAFIKGRWKGCATLEG